MAQFPTSIITTDIGKNKSQPLDLAVSSVHFVYIVLSVPGYDPQRF